MYKSLKLLALTSILLLFNNCSSESSPSANPQASGNTIQLTLNGIEKMQGQHYEGWAIGSNGVETTGRFNINDQGEIVAVNAAGEELAVLSTSNSANFAVASEVSSINYFVLTIEPDGDTDVGPSAIHYVEGDVTNGTGLATLDMPAAVGASFLQATGSYFLATPTNGPATHNQGIWYISGGNAGLNLPVLNPSFTYEGWIVDTETGEVLSTGTFDRPDQADSDLAGAAAGPNPAPPFPGQDYIDPARILNDGKHMAVISVEPVPDFDPAPFSLKILRSMIQVNAPVVTDIQLENFSNENAISIEISTQ